MIEEKQRYEQLDAPQVKSFLCRFGWHKWCVWEKVKLTVKRLDGNDTYEDVQIRTCFNCNLSKTKKI